MFSFFSSDLSKMTRKLKKLKQEQSRLEKRQSKKQEQIDREREELKQELNFISYKLEQLKKDGLAKSLDYIRIASDPKFFVPEKKYEENSFMIPSGKNNLNPLELEKVEKDTKSMAANFSLKKPLKELEVKNSIRDKQLPIFLKPPVKRLKKNANTPLPPITE